MQEDVTGLSGEVIDLGKGWKCRIDRSEGTWRKHIHIWKGKTEYIQSDNGSPSHKNKGEKGKLPRWLQDAVLEKTNWDYNGNREKFFSSTQIIPTGDSIIYSFADGSTKTQYNMWMTQVVSENTDRLEAIWLSSDLSTSSENVYTKTMYPFVDMSIPGFSAGYSPTVIPAFPY